MTKTILPKDLYKMLGDDNEIALIDVREQGVYSDAHMLAAVCIPLSRMERVIYDLVPRRSTRIVLVDDGPGDPIKHAETASKRLLAYGYTDVSILDGGGAEWQAAGFSLFSGVNVISKAFGEFVETAYDTPRISAEALFDKIRKREKLLILDARPREEFFRMNIPGAVNVPGAELVHRFFDLVPDTDTPVVVNCAGRTRSIIGAQSLINAGVPNPVAALKNGTMGWHLAGFDLEHHKKRPAPAPSADGVKHAIDRVPSVVDRFGIRKIDEPGLDKWKGETQDRTLYVLDVRSPEEFEAGHLEGARNTPGGQLVQATDEYAVVRNARIVLVDDNEVRAIMTASWLIQMGWADVFVLSGGMGKRHLVSGPHRSFYPAFTKANTIPASELKALLDAGEPTAVIDLATSRCFKQSHIPGAWWAVRSRLNSDLSRLPRADRLVLTSSDGIFAHLAAGELAAAGHRTPVSVLDGGTAAWLDAGFPAEKGLAQAISPKNDLWYKPYERPDAPEKAMQEYLDWEVALVEKVEKDGTVGFRRFTKP